MSKLNIEKSETLNSQLSTFKIWFEIFFIKIITNAIIIFSFDFFDDKTIDSWNLLLLRLK